MGGSSILFTPVMVSNCFLDRVVRSSKFYSLDFFNFAKPLRLILKSCNTMIGGKKPHASEIRKSHVYLSHNRHGNSSMTPDLMPELSYEWSLF